MPFGLVNRLYSGTTDQPKTKPLDLIRCIANECMGNAIGNYRWTSSVIGPAQSGNPALRKPSTRRCVSVGSLKGYQKVMALIVRGS